jgi:hypothetical protein
MPNPMIKDDREQRLPVWARELIGDLRREVTNAWRERDDAVGGHGPDDAHAVIDIGQGGTRRYVGVPTYHGQVRFLLDGPGQVDGRYVEVSVTGGPGWTDYPAGEVQVRGSEQIIMRPSSGNVVLVGVKRR